MSKIYPIASGSSGNCTYIGHGKSGILIDAGISCRCIANALALAAVDPKKISAVFVTHQHTDHIQGLKTFTEKFGIPVFSSEGTAEALESSGYVARPVKVFDTSVQIGDMLVERFSTSHDCADSSGYRITLPDGRFCAVCTDLGYVSDSVRQALSGCTAILIESNHDVNMLQRGSYPEYLKRRILSDKGHLSNTACSSELGSLVESGTTRIILGHLSRENNRPEIAHSSAAAALMDRRMIENEDYLLYTAPPKDGKVILF